MVTSSVGSSFPHISAGRHFLNSDTTFWCVRCNGLDYHGKALKTVSLKRETVHVCVFNDDALWRLWGADAMRDSGMSEVMSLGAEGSRT